MNKEENINEKKQRLKEYNAAYYQKNKDKIIKRLTEKITCTCGRTICKNSLKILSLVLVSLVKLKKT